MEVKVKKLNERAKLPTFGTDFSAGADLYCVETEDIVVHPQATVFVRTGISMEIPTGYVGLVFPRSGLACKRGLCLANCVGVIDSDYRGEIKVALNNEGNLPQTVSPEERVAQIIIMSYPKINFVEETELTETSRGGGGFGSTGKF